MRNILVGAVKAIGFAGAGMVLLWFGCDEAADAHIAWKNRKKVGPTSGAQFKNQQNLE